MFNSSYKSIIPEHNFLFTKLVFWMQLIIFGGWNGLHIIIQPQDLSIFVAKRGFLDNFFFTMSYSWQNIPLICLILFSIATFWNFRSIALDQQIINNLKKRDDINVIPYRDKDNIAVFITGISLIIWIFCFSIIYFIPSLDLNFLTNLLYNIPGIERFQKPLFLMIVLLSASIILTLRIQLLLFYSGGKEMQSLTKFLKSVSKMKVYYIKSWLISLLSITISLLIYKYFFLSLFINFRYLLPEIFLVNIPLIVNRVDVIAAIPSLVLLFLVSALFFSPIVIYLYVKIIDSQYYFYKQQFIKEKNKKNIDEIFESNINSLNKYPNGGSNEEN